MPHEMQSIAVPEALYNRMASVVLLNPPPMAVPGGTQHLVGGDFDGDGFDEIACVVNGTLGSLPVDGGSLSVGTGIPVSGDFNGDGVETVAIYDKWRARFIIYHRLGDDPWRTLMTYGSTVMIPVGGRFGELEGGDEPPEVQRGLGELQEGDNGEGVKLLQTELTSLNL